MHTSHKHSNTLTLNGFGINNQQINMNSDEILAVLGGLHSVIETYQKHNLFTLEQRQEINKILKKRKRFKKTEAKVYCDDTNNLLSLILKSKYYESIKNNILSVFIPSLVIIIALVTVLYIILRIIGKNMDIISNVGNSLLLLIFGLGFISIILVANIPILIKSLQLFDTFFKIFTSLVWYGCIILLEKYNNIITGDTILTIISYTIIVFGTLVTSLGDTWNVNKRYKFCCYAALFIYFSTYYHALLFNDLNDKTFSIFNFELSIKNQLLSATMNLGLFWAKEAFISLWYRNKSVLLHVRIPPKIYYL